MQSAFFVLLSQYNSRFPVCQQHFFFVFEYFSPARREYGCQRLTADSRRAVPCRLAALLSKAKGGVLMQNKNDRENSQNQNKNQNQNQSQNERQNKQDQQNRNQKENRK